VAIVDHGRVVSELSMAELTQGRGVSVRVTDLDGAGREVAARYGPTRLDGEWLLVDGIVDEAIPRLVGELVALGGSIHAVVPTRHTLEERFLSLLGAAPDAPDGPGRAGPAASDSAASESTARDAARTQPEVGPTPREASR
jgi:hypothetical protein